MKYCRGCKTEKQISEFYKHNRMADGRLNHCKSCVCKRITKYRATNLYAIREYDRARAKTKKRLLRLFKNTTNWRSKNPEKYSAHVLVNNKIRSGELVKKPCEKCGVTKRVHAHHDDYSKPLSIMWLCAVHHSERHKELNS